MKNLLFAVSLITLSVCAMEKENKPQNQWSVTVKNTKINLYRGNILDSGDAHKADVMVVEKYPKTIKNDFNQAKTRMSFVQKNKGKIVEVNGPCVEVSPYLDVFYQRYKPSYKLYHARLFRKDAPLHVDEVIAEVLKDLKLCYTEHFTNAIQEKNGKIAKSIALQALGIGSYKSHFPESCDLENKAMQCTATTIFEFIKSNPDAYDNIELFVEEEFEFNVCKKLLGVMTSK